MDVGFQSLPVIIISRDGRENGSFKYDEDGATVATYSEIQFAEDAVISLETLTREAISYAASAKQVRENTDRR